MAVISTAGLSKTYGKQVAVDGISFEVEAGQVFGFLGPNGSGKTTTIGMLLGIITPTGGGFELFGGSSAGELHAARQRIGATLEYPNFYPYLSGRDNLKLVSRVKGRDDDEVLRVLETVGLGDRRDSLFKTFSLGMKQRLALASTMIGDPELIILDEPANGLDPEGMKEIREIILGLADRGKTIFLSSHLLAEVEKTCDHVAIIKNGSIVRQSSVAELTSGGTVARLVAANLDKLQSIVEEYPETTNVSCRDDGVIAELKTEDLGGLNRWVAERGIYVSHLSLEQRSLEDVFIELTNTGEFEAEVTL